jgi:glucose-6-phosphate 1-dehydrogenase
MPETKIPTIFVIFGITGDLAQRKLLPALYHLIKDDLVHEKTRIVGLSRREVGTQDILNEIRESVCKEDGTCDEPALDTFGRMLEMLQFAPAEQEEYRKLKAHMDRLEENAGECMNRLFYLSIPPNVYGTVVTNLGEADLASGCVHGNGKSSLLVEKPFGYDLRSAEELISHTNLHFDEKQVYRIDHYLAKETAQNILAFRRQNPLFHGVWNGQHVSRVEVVAFEQIGVEGRGGFYDDVGALRDLIQSHLMQLLALTTMELPSDETDSALHASKQQLLGEVEPVPADMVHSRVKRGQYEGYRDEVSNPSSNTETYVELELFIPSGRWQNTGFVLKTGKAMDRKQTYTRIIFKGQGGTENQLTFRLQPNEGIDVTLQVKKPGFRPETEPALLNFDYASAAHPDAYERVLVDAILGNHQLFASSEEVLLSWRILQPILDVWQQNSDDLRMYARGATEV